MLERRVAALPRAQLEALICASVRGGAPVAEASLVPPPPREAVRVKSARLGASVGCFTWLSEDVFGLLLDALSATSRMTLTLCVCKTFREVAERLPLTRFTLAEYRQYGTRPRDTLWMPPSAWGGVAGPLAFLKARGAEVRTLELELDYGPDYVPAIVDLVRATPKLTSLKLAGKKMTALVMKPLLKLAMPRLKQLTALTIGRHVSVSAAMTNVLAAAANVEALTIDNRAGPGVLATACAAWTKRRGGPPLLQSLTLENSEEFLEAVGVICPELRNLTLKSVLAYEFILEKTLRMPPALQSLTVRLWAYEDRPNDDYVERQHGMVDNAAILRRLFRACPVARSISVVWRDRSGSDEAVVRHKHVEDALASLPKTLESLELGQMSFGDVDRFAISDVPSMRELTLCGCLGTAAAVAARRAAGVAVIERDSWHNARAY